MGLNLVPQSHPALRAMAKPVSDYGSQRLVELVEEMEDLRIEAGGIGLAAPQVGVSERIIIVEVPEEDWVGCTSCPSFPPTALLNPEIVWESEEQVKLPEGCLSLPGLMGNVIRPASITVAAVDLDGDPFTIHADRWLARVLQHEMDHLDGILYPDKIEEPGELWHVERVDINDPVWANNPHVQRIREQLEPSEADQPHLV